VRVEIPGVDELDKELNLSWMLRCFALVVANNWGAGGSRRLEAARIIREMIQGQSGEARARLLKDLEGSLRELER